MAGAFQTSRELFENPIWKNIVEFRLFFLIYGKAIFAEEGVRIADDLFLNRGEWCRSTRKLQEDLTYIENRQIKTYSTSVIHRAIVSLVKAQRLCTRMHELGTVFTVVNYEQYQGFERYRKSNLEHNLEQSGNSGGTVGEQSGNNNKKEKKDIKEEEVLKPLAEVTAMYDSEFEMFWLEFPSQRKRDKAKTYGIWKKEIKTIPKEQLTECVKRYAKDKHAIGHNGNYAKMPTTFLNAKTYKDYLIGGNDHASDGRSEGSTGKYSEFIIE